MSCRLQVTAGCKYNIWKARLTRTKSQLEVLCGFAEKVVQDLKNEADLLEAYAMLC